MIGLDDGGRLDGGGLNFSDMGFNLVVVGGGERWWRGWFHGFSLVWMVVKVVVAVEWLVVKVVNGRGLWVWVVERWWRWWWR